MSLNPQEHDSAEEESRAESAQEKAAPERALYRYDTRMPAELEAGPVDEEEYQQYRATTDLREPYRIAREYLANTKKFTAPAVTEAPLIVFINSKSGGRVGPALTEVLYQSLGHAQVYDLQDYRPGIVLKKIWENFETQRKAGDAAAAIVQSRFRILAAGGDGTVAWILGTIKELNLDPPPLVAVMPLGTGNDLSLSFGWGNTFLAAWIKKHNSIYETLKRVADSEARDLDAWSISITADGKGAFKDLPHSLIAADGQGAATSKVKGMFWNYFSLGMDAEAAYGFHHLREQKPWAASSRLVNQAWYGIFSCTTGWFCNAPPISAKAAVKVRSPGGEWQEVALPKSIKALVVLNLQSYAGGRDLWGLKDSNKDAAKGWKVPIFNDGLIEVVGLKSGYHTALVMGGVHSKIHAKRLAQACEVKIELRAAGPTKGDTGLTHMQLDGEPWPQAIPAAKGAPPITVHIQQAGTSKMLFNSVKLKGIAPKIQKLAIREGEVSKQGSDGQAAPSLLPTSPSNGTAGKEIPLEAVPSQPTGSTISPQPELSAPTGN